MTQIVQTIPFNFMLPDDPQERRLIAYGLQLAREFIEAGMNGLPESAAMQMADGPVIHAGVIRSIYFEMVRNLAGIEETVLTVDQPEPPESVQ